MTDQAAPRVAEYLNTGISKPRAVIPEDEWHRDTPAGSYNLVSVASRVVVFVDARITELCLSRQSARDRACSPGATDCT